jgi:cytochrome c peroxidase
MHGARSSPLRPSLAPLALPLALVSALVLGVACGGDEPAALGPAASAPDAGRVSDVPAALCVDGKPVDWPPGPYEIALGSTLPKDLVFQGPEGPVKIADGFDPCATKPRLLVVRSSGSWCGTCLWHQTHTTSLLADPRLQGRIDLVDLLIGDEDNAPPTLAAASRWKAGLGAPAKVAIDPKYTFAAVPLPHAPLPAYVVIDTRTMIVRTVMDNPAPETLTSRLASEVAQVDGLPRLDIAAPTLTDELFSRDQWEMIAGMKLVPAPPADPTNAFGDLPSAVALGKKLFFDVDLSPSRRVSCASCHVGAQGFTDGAPQSTGIARVNRNAPPIPLAAHARWQFWDGRADTLWAQALGPIEDAKEMGSTRLFVAKQIAQRYGAEYDALFAAKYPRPDLAGLPDDGKPGDAAFDALPKATRDAVTRVFVNVGKSIAAFERSLRVRPNALDRYAGGDLTALNAAQKKGLLAFFRVGCAQCHFGPRLTNDAFHALRFATGRQDGAPDKGRIDVLAGLGAREFVASSSWSDAPEAAKPLTFDPAQMPGMLGAFKTPTLRGLPLTAPYGHGGTLATLLDVARHYGQRGLDAADPLTVGVTEEWVGMFDHGAQRDLVPFLEVLSADVE